MAVTVMNLCTAEKWIYTCSPRDAVIACYAQNLRPSSNSTGDYNTWDYEKNYGHLVEEGKFTWLCGDYSAFKDGRRF